MKKNILYIIATPIGNLEDITLRALRVIKEEVEVIFCEDTRVTRKLLSHYDIEGKKLISCNKENEHKRIPELLDLLNQGQNVALMSDAGTPLVSDPGSEMVKAIYEQLRSEELELINISNHVSKNVNSNDEDSSGISLTSIPGASALTVTLSLCPFDTTRFAFEGFLPHSGQHRRRVLKKLVDEERPMVFYESPHRILKTLEDMKKIFTQVEAATEEVDQANLVAKEEGYKVFAVRELTKIHEEFYLGTFEGLISRLKTQFPSKVQGEFVLVVSPKC